MAENQEPAGRSGDARTEAQGGESPRDLSAGAGADGHETATGRRQGRAHDLFAAALGNVMAPLASFASAPILAHALGVTGRGELAAATAPFLFASIAATAGIPEAITYHTARRRGGTRLIWRSVPVLVVVAVISAIAIVMTAGLVSAGDEIVRALVTVSAFFLVPTAVLSALRAVAAGYGDWRSVRDERMIGAAARLLPTALLAITGTLSVTSASAIVLAAPLLGAVAYIRLRKQHERQVPVTQREVLVYGSRVWIGSLSGVLLSRLDQILMNPITGARELGLYVVAVNISEVTLVVMTTVTSTIFTSDARDRDDAVLAKTARLTLFTMLVVAVVIGVSLPLWVAPFFGAGFEHSIPAAWVLLGTYVVTAPGAVAGSALGARGNPGSASLSLMVAVVVNTIAVLLLTPSFGALGAAFATLAGNGTASIMRMVFLNRRHGVRLAPFFVPQRADFRDLLSPIRRRTRVRGG